MPDSSRLALITGASAGIGMELARVFAREGHPLVLTARREDRLEQLARELEGAHGIDVRVVAADLTEAEAPVRLFEQLSGEAVDVLVNNAGFGASGRFHELDRRRQLDMIQLNVAALTDLTHLFLGPMVTRGRGSILNVASTAAFQPGPLMAVYYASKTYVLSLSEALAEELSGTGVSVTALCPGPTKSEFQATAEIEETRMAQMLMDAEPVAEAGYRGMASGKRIVIPGLLNKLTAQSHRIGPRNVVTKVVKRINQRQ